MQLFQMENKNIYKDVAGYRITMIIKNLAVMGLAGLIVMAALSVPATA